MEFTFLIRDRTNVWIFLLHFTRTYVRIKINQDALGGNYGKGKDHCKTAGNIGIY